MHFLLSSAILVAAVSAQMPTDINTCLYEVEQAIVKWESSNGEWMDAKKQCHDRCRSTLPSAIDQCVPPDVQDDFKLRQMKQMHTNLKDAIQRGVTALQGMIRQGTANCDGSNPEHRNQDQNERNHVNKDIVEGSMCYMAMMSRFYPEDSRKCFCDCMINSVRDRPTLQEVQEKLRWFQGGAQGEPPAVVRKHSPKHAARCMFHLCDKRTIRAVIEASGLRKAKAEMMCGMMKMHKEMPQKCSCLARASQFIVQGAPTQADCDCLLPSIPDALIDNVDCNQLASNLAQNFRARKRRGTNHHAGMVMNSASMGMTGAQALYHQGINSASSVTNNAQRQYHNGMNSVHSSSMSSSQAQYPYNQNSASSQRSHNSSSSQYPYNSNSASSQYNQRSNSASGMYNQGSSSASSQYPYNQNSNSASSQYNQGSNSASSQYPYNQNSASSRMSQFSSGSSSGQGQYPSNSRMSTNSFRSGSGSSKERRDSFSSRSGFSSGSSSMGVSRRNPSGPFASIMQMMHQDTCGRKQKCINWEIQLVQDFQTHLQERQGRGKRQVGLNPSSSSEGSSEGASEESAEARRKRQVGSNADSSSEGSSEGSSEERSAGSFFEDDDILEFEETLAFGDLL